MAEIRLEKVTKRFGGTEVVRGIDLTVREGELAVLVGPSGCGKTTTLRMIAGLETVSDGAILFDGQPVSHLAPKDRDIAMVFQSYALYPHMTVRGNLAFSLKMKGVPRAEREGLVRRAAEMLGIDALLDRKPRELSGGQRQRVAMGRALVREPRAFLLDEPLSNLDAALRAQMRIELKRIHQRLKTTIVYVTHDQIEAMTLADRIVVMRGGHIEQVGDPMSVYQAPVSKFVAGFIGSPRMNFIPAQLFDDLGTLKARLPGGEALTLPNDRAAAYRALVGAPVELGIRPEHLTDRPELTRGSAGDDSHAFENQVFEGVVDVVEPMGATSLITFTLAGGVYHAIGEAGPVRRPGERLRLSAHLRHMHLIDSRTEQVVPVVPASAAQHEQRQKAAV
jgi:multiple sugar transport system ATP-binding protein